MSSLLAPHCQAIECFPRIGELREAPEQPAIRGVRSVRAFGDALIAPEKLPTDVNAMPKRLEIAVRERL